MNELDQEDGESAFGGGMTNLEPSTICNYSDGYAGILFSLRGNSVGFISVVLNLK